MMTTLNGLRNVRCVAQARDSIIGRERRVNRSHRIIELPLCALHIIYIGIGSLSASLFERKRQRKLVTDFLRRCATLRNRVRTRSSSYV